MLTKNQTSVLSPDPREAGVSDEARKLVLYPVTGEIAENSSPAGESHPNTTQNAPAVSERARDNTDEFLARFAAAADFSSILKSINDTLARVGSGQ